jgi:hypothetical protein
MSAALLTNFLFWTGAAIGGIVFAALVDVTGGTWLGPMRIAAERFRRFLPISFALFLIVMWQRREIYSWARSSSPDPWYRPEFVLLRDALAFVAVYGCAFAYCRASRRAREDPSAAHVGRSAVILLVVYAIGFSVVAVDLIMSLEPRWSSTLFPAYVFTGNVYAGVAAIAALTVSTSEQSDSAATARARDVANVLVGVGLFWMYLFWSQFLVIWYGNLTAEVGFMTARIGTWRPLGWIVLGMCCAIPAIVCVPQWGKRMAVVRPVTLVILAGLWLERWLLVASDLPAASALETSGVTLAIGALFLLSVVPLGRRS